MFALISILLVGVVNSHRFFAVVKGEDGKFKTATSSLVHKSSMDQILRIQITDDLEIEEIQYGDDTGFEITSRLNVFTWHSIADEALTQTKKHFFSLENFDVSSVTPFLGIIKESKSFLVAYIFFIPDNADFDVDLAINAALHFTSLPEEYEAVL